MRLPSGREASLVGRPDFKSGWGRQPALGGFDSHSLPPRSPGVSTDRVTDFDNWVALRRMQAVEAVLTRAGGFLGAI